MGGVSGVAPISEDVKYRAKEMGTNLTWAIRNRTEFQQEMKEILSRRDYFRRIIELRKEEWSEEYEYWKERGWLH